MNKKSGLFALIILALALPLDAQQFNSVPLGHDAYKIIEIGIMRGIVSPPPSAKPWSELTVARMLREIYNSQSVTVSPNELKIIANILESFNRKKGLDSLNGRYYIEEAAAASRFSFEAGLNWESNFSFGLALQGPPALAISTINKLGFFLAGDMGKHVSWYFNSGGGFLKTDRALIGFADSLENPVSPVLPVYGIPAYFPYVYSKAWEAAVFPFKNFGSSEAWPERFSMFYEMGGELSSSFLDNRLFFRIGRMRRDWGLEENGGSLYLNGKARPFMAFEGTAVPLPWLYFSFLSGVLEAPNAGLPQADNRAYQNIFSIGLAEIKLGKHFYFDFGSSFVFDNATAFADLQFVFSNSKIWMSVLIDDIQPKFSDFFLLDRNMYAYQGGFKTGVSWFPFGTLTFRYTKIEPYTYTGSTVQTPWLHVLQNTAYLNNGESLGFYLPPNSDELFARLEAMPLREITANLQYQLIRHGTEWGIRKVDGSSIYDKIANKDVSQKYFLKDGAYQWDHIIKLGASYNLKTINIPLSFYADAGIVITRFTDSDAELGKEGNFSSVDNAVYRAGSRFIFSLGLKVY